MKICAAQIGSVKGDISSNIDLHLKFIDQAIGHSADLIIFPELSLTGYEPALAKELATDQDDRRFDVFQDISDTRHISIGIGMPTKNAAGVSISLILFQPHRNRQTYSKKYLHADEEPYFTRDPNPNRISFIHSNIALAICYEISIPAHAEDAFKNGAEIYIASVAKSANGVEKAYVTLAELAKTYSKTVLMVNSIGPCDDFNCAGKSGAWNKQGELMGQLDDLHQSLLLLDSETQEIIHEKIEDI